MSMYLFLLLHPVIFFIQSVRAESEPGISRISTNSLIKIDNLLKLRRQAVSEASALIPGYVISLILMSFSQYFIEV